MEKTERPLGELFSDLKQETRVLVRQEMELLKVELTAKAVQAGKDAVFMAIGGILLYTGLLTLVAALVLGVAEFIAPWLAALLVGVVLIAIAVVLVQKGRKDLARMQMTPERSTSTFKETAQWAKSELKGAR